jgi:hypothetical protein
MRPFAADHLLAGADAGAVDQAVQPAEGLDREIDAGGGAGFVGDVGLDEARVGTQLGGGGVAGRLVDVGQHDLAAIVHDHAGRRGAQAGTAAGDDEDIVLDAHRYSISSKDFGAKPIAAARTERCREHSNFLTDFAS